MAAESLRAYVGPYLQHALHDFSWSQGGGNKRLVYSLAWSSPVEHIGLRRFERAIVHLGYRNAPAWPAMCPRKPLPHADQIARMKRYLRRLRTELHHRYDEFLEATRGR